MSTELPNSTMTDVPIVTVTALALEFLAVERLLTDVSERLHPVGSLYRVGYLSVPKGRVAVAIVQAGAGNTTAALETERAIQLFLPRYVFLVGVAGGIKDVTLGDVVAASKVYGYESGKATEQFLPRPEVAVTAHALVQRAMAVAREETWMARLTPPHRDRSRPRAFVGPIAAGEKVLASVDSDFVRLIRQSYGDALAVEMEGYGAMRAAFAHTGVHALVIRGISDSIAGKAESDRAGWQERAVNHAAAFAAELIAALAAIEPIITKSAPAATHDMDQTHPAQSSSGSGKAEDALGKLQELAPVLYPTGPVERDVWARAGGDISRIDLNPIGRTAWRRALGLLARGGGGGITAKSLIDVMYDDFSNNEELRRLKSSE